MENIKNVKNTKEYNENLFLVLQAALEISDDSIIRQATNELVKFNSKMLHKICHEIVTFDCEYEDIYQNVVIAFITTLRKEASKPDTVFKGSLFTSTKNEAKKLIFEETTEVSKSYTTKKRHIREALTAATDQDGNMDPDKFDFEMKSKNNFKKEELNDNIAFEASAEDIAFKNIDDESCKKILSACFKKANLSKSDRKLISLRVINEITWEDLGKMFGMTHVGARKKYIKAAGKLRDALIEMGYPDISYIDIA